MCLSPLRLRDLRLLGDSSGSELFLGVLLQPLHRNFWSQFDSRTPGSPRPSFFSLMIFFITFLSWHSLTEVSPQVSFILSTSHPFHLASHSFCNILAHTCSISFYKLRISEYYVQLPAELAFADNQSAPSVDAQIGSRAPQHSQCPF